MTAGEFLDLQQALVFCFGPLLGWALVGMVVLSLLSAILIMFFSQVGSISRE